MTSLARSSTSTTPGDCPVTVALGTAAKPVTLSGATTILSLKPGSVIDADVPPEVWATLWLALLTTVMELFEALKTRVNLLLGNKTIKPGVGLVAPTEITPGESRSRCPSTTFRTGAVLVTLGNNGLETKTCTLMVAGFAPGVPRWGCCCSYFRKRRARQWRRLEPEWRMRIASNQELPRT